MRRILRIFVIMLAVSLTMFLPVSKELVFCCKSIDKEVVVASEVDGGIKSTLGLTAKSSILMEANTKKVIYGDSEHTKLAPASMTKVMTMILVMEDILSGKIALDDRVLISEYSASQEGSECFLDAGESYMLLDLLKAVAVASANDACVALAEACSGDEKLFVKRMNEKASELGMKNTHYVNCTGLDEVGHESTAYDLCLALNELSKYDIISELEKTWVYDLEHKGGRVTNLTNTNRLIRNNPDCHMAKTGHTDNAGYCIVIYGRRDNTNMIACVMGVAESSTRFEEATKLLNYGFTNFESMKLVDKCNYAGEVKVDGGKKEFIQYFPEEDIYGFKKKGEEASTKVNYIKQVETIKAPITESTTVGIVEVYMGEEKVGETKLITQELVEEKGVKDIMQELIA